MNKQSKKFIESWLSYNQEAGTFTWKYQPQRQPQWNSRCSGKNAGWDNGRYLVLQIEGKRYKAHHLAWLLSYGAWPSKEIDHINLDAKDNRICNLRLATSSQNCANRLGSNKHGYKGVSKVGEWFQARILVRGKKYSLGYRDSPEEAHELYKIAAKKYFGEFANTEIK